TVTSQRIHIGSYGLPAGTGGIQSSQAGFVEWCPWNSGEPANHCTLLPLQSTTFGIPRTTHAGSVGNQSLGVRRLCGESCIPHAAGYGWCGV
ncbi:hypothetical protein C8R47DRAFT_985571, partial [Mycena vitilis]